MKTITDALKAHKNLKGKIEIASKVKRLNSKNLGIYYTPGVGSVATYLSNHPQQAKNYTIKSNTVAIVSDGSAVLGLGNIGPEAAIPILEGKAMLYKTLAGVDAFPIILKDQSPEKIIETIINISPIFGGIQLEDIAAPKCFDIENALINELDIPVLHDDQHGTAIVTLAGLINCAKVINKPVSKMKIVIVGAGAAGSAIARLIFAFSKAQIVMLDSKGVIYQGRPDLDKNKRDLASFTNAQKMKGNLESATKNADTIIAVTTQGKGKISKQAIKSMNEKPIIMALANPTPEILPEQAYKYGAFIVATGRSGFPNQINNMLSFPGVFKGALQNSVKKITTEMKINASINLASVVKTPSRKKIIPSPFDKLVVKKVASAITNGKS